GNFAFRLVAPHLLIEGIKKLLPGSGPGECGAMVQSPAEAAKIEQSFRGAVEGHAHAVEQVDYAGRGIAHGFYGRLVAEEVSAINRVIEVLPGRIAFALQVLGSVDPALRTNRMRTLDGHNGK